MPECKADKDPCDILPVAGEAWSVCLPFGGRIWADDNGVHAKGGIAPPDGVYGKVVIADGCLVGVEPSDIPIYTGNPCSPLPTDCGGSSNIGGGFTPGNTTVICEIEAGSGVTVTGNGTEADPYVISAENGIYIRSDNAAISVTGLGTRQNPYAIAHKSGLATTVNGMTFDAFGHLASVNTNSASRGIQGIVPGFGITANTDNSTGIATISQGLQISSVPGDYLFGGFSTTLDQAGRVSAISREINISGAPVSVPCGAFDLSINQYGSITDIVDTLNLGSAYLASWGTGEAATQRVAQFTLRSSTALAGLIFSEASSVASAICMIDSQSCEKVDKLFWGAGVFLAGQHQLKISGVSGKVAVVLLAVTQASV